jgi:PIN domain nuclease of toxin-antitoxin system
MSSVVFDASTLLISINREPGLEVVSAIEDEIVISSVNYAEVVTKLALGSMSPDAIENAVSEYPMIILPFTDRLAMMAGLLASRTRHRGLSLGDRACLALAMELKLPVVTADRTWADLDLGIDIRQVR